MFDRLLHKFNEEIFVKMWGKYGAIYLTVWQSTRGSIVFLISVFLVREPQKVQDGSHHSIRHRCFGNDKLVAVQL